ncbi:Polarized growth protein (Boi2), putative [Penicillium digitatum PHI26]|uniref:Polarized growth protein (Boi2), putative n=1 Tax=Penicillium digitatum (strain PHI26 / CECT 20796) TaxID=1170229 RepID=K9FJA9_PEND2|nr:Polarized growth protein (Boi2), putative [Penicillium digitatum PHI26]
MVTMGPPQGVRPGDILEVLHEFGGRGEDELIMLPRDKIELIELDEGFGDAWYYGKNLRTGQTGLFPASMRGPLPGSPHHFPTVPPANIQNLSAIDFTKAGLPRKTLAESPVFVESPAQVNPAPADPSFASVGSGQSTPQATRHISSEMQSPQNGSPTQHRSASSPLPRTSLAADIQQAFRGSIDNHMNGEDSPVMNETLSVIDEHITDMNTPRHSVSKQGPRTINDSGSEYSSHVGHRASYINGHETDDEEQNQPTEQEVRKWSQTQTSRCLRELGIDPKHCNIFEEQEITGDVLLDMDQDFLFMKEFDFGVMGKRLKTWHKIKAFQEETKGFSQQRAPRGSISSSFSGPSDERPLSCTGLTGPLLPRIQTLSEKSGAGYPRASAPVQHPRLTSNNSLPVTPHTPPYSHDAPRRISAASLRDFNQNRRHSSIDATQRGMSESVFAGHHQKKPSFDRSWTLNSGFQSMSTRPGTSAGTSPRSSPNGPLTTEPDPYDQSYINAPDEMEDVDRGYFSGTEVDSRRSRRILQKRGSTSVGVNNHSRKSSYVEDPYNVIPQAKRHSRIGSVDSIRDAVKHVSPAAQAYHGTPPKSRMRSFSTRVSTDRSGNNSQSSTTDSKIGNGGGFFANFSRVGGKGDSESPSSRASPLQFQPLKNTGPKFRRAMGLRAISDVVGKKIDTSVPPDSPRGSDPTSARTGSTTPSATSKSSERHSTDESGKTATDGHGFVVRPRTVKSKKETSAYTRGLEKKSPREQMDGCDYSGWMKKRSSNLMTTWKPRLFVLRGRRLSYYYSEDDTEERGLIDITAHRVLRADQDPIIALHATITGSTALPANANNSVESSGGTKLITPSVIQSLTTKDDSGPFFFKLVPPKTGNSRTVQFTKPATHYFQVDNVQQGRRWMAALMKATIERDLGQAVESTNKQKTISLKQARLRNQRPLELSPASGGTKTEQTIDEEEEEAGLPIEGLNINQSDANSFEDTNSSLDIHNTNEGLDRPPSNPLGDSDQGHSSLLPDPLAKTDVK